MTRIALFLALLLAATHMPLAAQEAPTPAGGLHFTGFRSPATGLELRRGRLGVHTGFYPTILEADGQSDGENTNFIRIGVAAYLRTGGLTPYVAPALLLSLDDDWDNGILSEAGVRAPVTRRLALRGGVGVLTTFDGEVRVNPTVGFDVRLGR